MAGGVSASEGSNWVAGGLDGTFTAKTATSRRGSAPKNSSADGPSGGPKGGEEMESDGSIAPLLMGSCPVGGPNRSRSKKSSATKPLTSAGELDRVSSNDPRSNVGRKSGAKPSIPRLGGSEGKGCNSASTTTSAPNVTAAARSSPVPSRRGEWSWGGG